MANEPKPITPRLIVSFNPGFLSYPEPVPWFPFSNLPKMRKQVYPDNEKFFQRKMGETGISNTH